MEQAWTLFRVTAAPNADPDSAGEILQAALAGTDSCGTEEISTPEGPAWLVYFPAGQEPGDFQQLLQDSADGFGLPGLFKVDSPSLVPKENWQSGWRQYFTPQSIDNQVLILPSWETALAEEARKKGQLPVLIEPGMAFGTGTHATTQLCLLLTRTVLPAGGRVLDIGTGSGILAITALLLGADTATCIDNDPEVEENLLENLRLNGIDTSKTTIHIGDLEGCPSPAGYDLIYCNMLSREFLPLMPSLPGLLSSRGVLLLSGLLATEEEEIRQAASANGLVVESSHYREEWAALVTRRAD